MKLKLLSAFFIAALTVSANSPRNKSMHPKRFNFEFITYNEKTVTSEVEKFHSLKSRKHPEFGVNPHNTQCRNCFEVIDKRQFDGRFFIEHKSDGTIFYVQKSATPLHYLDKRENWRTLDHHLRHHPQKPDVYMAPFQFFTTTIDLNTNTTSLQVGNLNFDFNHDVKLYFEEKGEAQLLGKPNLKNTSVGNDGALSKEAWPGIDIQQVFRMGEVKTNYVIKQPLNLPGREGFLVFEQKIHLPKGFRLMANRQMGIENLDGFWQGELIIRDSKNTGHIRFGEPRYYNLQATKLAIGSYDLRQEGNDYYVRLMVPQSFLTDNPSQYPIIIDPLVMGLDSLGMFMFAATALPPPPTQYTAQLPFTSVSIGSCDFLLNVTVPGESEITDTYIDLEYSIQNDPTCDVNWSGVGPACVFVDLTMEVIGPCFTTGQLACNPAFPPFVGTCTTDSFLVPWATPIYYPSFISCIPPQCPDYSLDFILKNREYRCNPPNSCGYKCAEGNFFQITIQARTLESILDQTFTDSNVVLTNLICPGDSVEMTNFPDWGVPPYSYLWSPGGQTDSMIIVQPMQTTNYSVTVSDVCGASVVNNYIIVVKAVEMPDAGPDTVVCEGEIVLIGGSPTNPTTSLTWWSSIPVNATNYMTSTTEENPSVQIPFGMIDTFAFVVHAVDSGCTVQDTMLIITVPFPNPTVIPPNPAPVCLDEFVTLTADAGYSEYLWSDGSTSQAIDVYAAGIYDVIVTDANGCTGTSNQVSVSFKPEPQILVQPDQYTILAGESVVLNLITDTSNLDSWSWSPATWLSCTDCLNPVSNPEEDIMYIATVVLDSCVKYDTAWVNIIHPVPYTIPNAFSPNGDGVNDVFRVIVVDEEVDILDFKVFNRWGEKVYDDPAGQWNGMFRGEKQPISTFTYMIKILTLEHGEVLESGNVTLVR